MGVLGLWSLLRSVKQPVDLESLEGKILAIDVSIWLNQAMKSDNPSSNAHLQTLFFRICKLLHYRIKPVFVYDGTAPALKRVTLEKRRQQKFNARELAGKYRTKLLHNYLKKEAVRRTLVKRPKVGNPVEEEAEKMFQLVDSV